MPSPSDRNVSRRDFLKVASATLAAPYVLTSTALGGPDKRSANDRITVVVIGLHNRGGNLIGGVTGNRDAQLVGLCDCDRKILKKKLGGHKGVKGYHDFRELMADDSVDAVAIATPDHSHAMLTVAACKAGKDVYCEKPMTLTIKEGRVMAEAVRRYGRVFQCGSQRRSEGGWRHKCELVRNGRIGELKRVDVRIPTRSGKNATYKPQDVPDHFDYDMWLGPAPEMPYHQARCHYNFRFVTDYSGGDVTNWGAHYLDMAQWGIGADDSGPVEIEGTGKRHGPGTIHDCFFDVDVRMRYAGGVELRLRSGGKACKFIGTEGSLPGDLAPGASDKIGPGDIHLHRAHGGHMGSWFHGIRTRQDPSAPVEVGHRSSTVCHLANIAMTLKRPLKWDPEAERFVGDEEANRMTWRPYREPWTL